MWFAPLLRADLCRYAFFTGPPFLGLLIKLPQRFQAVNGLSPLEAGKRLLPLLLSSPVGTGISGYLVSNRKSKTTPVLLMVLGAALQLLGIGLILTIPSDHLDVPNTMYGFEVIIGFGFGLGLSTLLLIASTIVDKNDVGNQPSFEL